MCVPSGVNISGNSGERMRRVRILSALFVTAGILLAVFTAVLSVSQLEAGPVLLWVSGDATDRAESFVTALSEGSLSDAEQMLYGTPDLGFDRPAADGVSQLIWDAFVQSMECRLSGDLYATDRGLAQNMSVTALDITSVTETLKTRSEAMLEQRVEAAEDVSQVYDGDNEYREDFVLGVLYDAAVESLEKDARHITREITLNLVYAQDQWWVMPDQALLQVISGDTAG